MIIGDINKLKVLRKTDVAYILSDGQNEIFLHKKQTNKELENGEYIDAFLYYDNQRRVTATTKMPFIDINNAYFVKVVDTNKKLGVFVDIGIIKDMLLSRDDFNETFSNWPKVGDTLFCRLRASKNQLSAKMVSRGNVSEYITPLKNLEEGEQIEAYVLDIRDEGIVLFSKDGHDIFVYYKNTRKKHRLGEKVDVKIIKVNEDNKYNGTLIFYKELMIDDDSETILEFLRKSKGKMKYTDKSNADEIYKVFRMSKSAFKRALGRLYKNGIIKLESDFTELIKIIE